MKKKEVRQKIIQECLFKSNSWSWYELENNVTLKHQEAGAPCLLVLTIFYVHTIAFNWH